MTTLRESVHRLTRPHLTMNNGAPTQVPALLDQLDKAVTEKRGGAGCTSGGSPSPISTAALSLKQDIEKEIRDHQRERVGYEAGTTKGILHAWATLDGEWADFLARVTMGWCDRIVAMLQPVKPPRRLHRPCPSCGVLYGGADMKPGLQVHCWAEDETMLPPGDWTAECQHCGAAWSGAEISWLTRAVNV